jgi:hypothetical protein
VCALISPSSPSLFSTCVHGTAVRNISVNTARPLPFSCPGPVHDASFNAIDTWVLCVTEHDYLTLGICNLSRPDIGLVRGSGGRGSVVRAYSKLRRCALRTPQYDFRRQIPDLTIVLLASSGGTLSLEISMIEDYTIKGEQVGEDTTSTERAQTNFGLLSLMC